MIKKNVIQREEVTAALGRNLMNIGGAAKDLDIEVSHLMTLLRRYRKMDAGTFNMRHIAPSFKDPFPSRNMFTPDPVDNFGKYNFNHIKNPDGEEVVGPLKFPWVGQK